MPQIPLPLDINALVGDIIIAATAFALAVPLGWDREKARRPAGLRTFPLVSLASCAFVLLGLRAFPDSPDAQARIVQGLMTGIGFIGGGAILKKSDTGIVEGVTTAASLWNTAAIGACVAFRRLELAVVLTLVNFVILRWLGEIKPAAE